MMDIHWYTSLGTSASKRSNNVGRDRRKNFYRHFFLHRKYSQVTHEASDLNNGYRIRSTFYGKCRIPIKPTRIRSETIGSTGRIESPGLSPFQLGRN